VHPTAGELLYLRLSVSSPKSFEDLRAVKNVIYPTLKVTCNVLGLLEGDREWEICLRVTAVNQTDTNFALFFAKILAFCNPTDPARLWNTIRDVQSEDLHPRDHNTISLDQRESLANQRADIALINLQVLLRNLGKTLDDSTNDNVGEANNHIMSTVREPREFLSQDSIIAKEDDRVDALHMLSSF